MAGLPVGPWHLFCLSFRASFRKGKRSFTNLCFSFLSYDAPFSKLRVQFPLLARPIPVGIGINRKSHFKESNPRNESISTFRKTISNDFEWPEHGESSSKAQGRLNLIVGGRTEKRGWGGRYRRCVPSERSVLWFSLSGT